MPPPQGRAPKRRKVSHKGATHKGASRPVEHASIEFPKNVSIGHSKGKLFDSSEVSRRLLTLHESEYWSSSLGAKFAASQYRPGNVCRPLGTITRMLKSTTPYTVEELVTKSKPSRREGDCGIAARKPNNGPSKGQVTTFVKKHIRTTKSKESSDQHNSWLEGIRNAGSIVPRWNSRTGEIQWNDASDGINTYINKENSKSSTILSCRQIVTLLKRNHLQDSQPSLTAEFYNGLKTIPVNVMEVLEALLDLTTPVSALWSQPIIVALPILEICSDHGMLQNSSSLSSYRLTIGVYVNRLLFESTTQKLEVVMAALDKGSYHIDQPLTPAPSLEGNPPAVFESDPWPKVVYDTGDDNSLGSDADEDRESTTRAEDYLDAFSPSGFLKLIENHGTNIQDWNLLEQKIAGRLEADLMLHQIHGVCWMHSMEHTEGGLNSLLWEKRCFPEGDTFYYSPVLGQARLQLTSMGQDNPAVTGGILADEMGLGKTVQVLALVLATLSELQDNAKSMSEDYWHATLIIVPPALVSQWIAEVQKIAGNSLVVDFFCRRTAEFHRQVSSAQTAPNPSDHRSRRADIVITTYQALDRHSKAVQILSKHTWGRVVLDEMQEIRSWTTTISKGCQCLRSNRRWMLSGTPITQSVDDFRGELCFLGLEPFAASNDDGFWIFAVSNHWENRSRYGIDILRVLSLIMLRRSKSMSIRDTKMPLLGLKPLTVMYEPVPQDNSERALYCFTEFLMHASIRRRTRSHEEDADEGPEVLTKKEIRTKRAFLRILNELCVSPFLLNGGLGCLSQLGQFNNLNKDYNRLHGHNSQAAHTHQGDYSCDAAIRYLSQVEDSARTDDDFVTDVRFGGGDGISRRDRAHNSPEIILKSKKEILKEASSALDAARSRRARARWRYALEKVTTGGLSAESLVGLKESVVQIWKWRANALKVSQDSGMPSLLIRGWRPTLKFFGTNRETDQKLDKKTFLLHQLYNKINGTRFLWAHPFALFLQDIPEQVTEDEIHQTFLSLLNGTGYRGGAKLVVYPLQASANSTWKAFVHFERKQFFDLARKELKSEGGIKLKCKYPPSFVRENIKVAEEKLEEAMAANTVHPCWTTSAKVNEAREELKFAQLGLCIQQQQPKQPILRGNVVCEKAFAASLWLPAPKTANLLFSTTEKIVGDSTELVAQKRGEVGRLKVEVSRLEKRIKNQVSGRLRSLNTFEKLQKLKEGQHDEDISCPICLEDLGQSDGSEGKIALTRCGHMSCFECMQKWLAQDQGMTRACVECRKPIKTGEVIRVDPALVNEDDEQNLKRQTEAKSLIRQAAEMLKTNHGKLEPRFWHALYWSVDLPPQAALSRSMSCTAIPGHFLAHLRHSTGLHLNAGRNHGPSCDSKLPSKIRALLEDIPKDELSVVFASSKTVVCHMMAVLERKGYGCRGLFAGQTEKDSEVAVSEWQSNFPQVLVLVVQAGRAACGLTLTAARKMFLLEPFRSHEEEKQAYARLHRYGQRHAVTCKIYYTPVSVESRLLEWRRRATNHAADLPSSVYAELRDIPPEEEEDSDSSSEEAGDSSASYDDDDDDSESDDEQNQINFLLGLDREI